MNQHYEAFRKKLQEIFMMDHAELDFGIYRIMNQPIVATGGADS